MQLTPEHHALRDSLTQFIDSEINPHVEEWERIGKFPAHALFKKLGRLGFLGVNKPEAFGGMGLDYSFQLIVAETIGRVHCGAIPMAIGVQTDMATPALARFGSDELRREFLAPAISGDMVSCVGISEVTAGSDVAAIRTTARAEGDEYVINGGKMWITNGSQADWMCLLAVTGDGPAHLNKSQIIVPLDRPGVTIGRVLDKLGMRSSDTAQIHFDDVRIPRRFRIGEEGQGFRQQMLQFQEERLWGSASVLMALEKCIADTMAYARERKAFGSPLIANQVIQFRLAELQTEIEALRALIYRAVDCYLDGQDVTSLASMTKLKAGRVAREVVDGCLQYWGGMGFMSDTAISRAYRDLRLVSIGGGTDEMMLRIIAKSMSRTEPNR
jgi:citronellyl-CoA dehydrogenase